MKVIGPSTLIFPRYDGNGIYCSAGNLLNAPKAGLLFIDFETPNRLRVQGEAEIVFEHPLLQTYMGAESLVSMAAEAIWVNSPATSIRIESSRNQSTFLSQAGKRHCRRGSGSMPCRMRSRRETGREWRARAERLHRKPILSCPPTARHRHALAARQNGRCKRDRRRMGSRLARLFL